jgi:prophage regulatory protein
MDRLEVVSSGERRAGTATPEVRLIRIKEVLRICGKSRSSVYEAIQKGEFPKPVKLRGRSSGWIRSEIENWVHSCIKASRTE